MRTEYTKFEKNERPGWDTTRAERLRRRVLGPLAIIAAGSAVAGMGHAAQKDQREAMFHDVVTVPYEIHDGDNATSAINEALDQMPANEQDGAQSVTNVVREAQDLSREMKALSGSESLHPGDDIRVTLERNGKGNYRVEAQPAPTNSETDAK